MAIVIILVCKSQYIVATLEVCESLVICELQYKMQQPGNKTEFFYL